MSNWLEVIECQTADEFVNALRPTHERWSRNSLEPEWLYRGVRDEKFPLQPSAWLASGTSPSFDASPFGRLREVIGSHAGFDNFMLSYCDVDRPPFGLEPSVLVKWRSLNETLKKERIREFVVQIAFELQLLHDFWRIADNVGHQIDAIESLKSYKLGDLLHLITGGEREKFFETSLAATAQHHGVPTRLLDWTTHPLKAAFFATRGFESTSDIAVWALRRGSIRQTRLREFRIPRHVLPNLHAQAGCFIWDPHAAADFALTGEWPCFDKTIKVRSAEWIGGPPRPWVYKLILPRAEVACLSQMLWNEDISEAHLMPSFDSVTRTLSDSISWRNDECPLL